MANAYKTLEGKEEGHLLVFYLYEDEEMSVRVEEVERVNLFDVVQHLSLGGSVFIAPREKPQKSVSMGKKTAETAMPRLVILQLNRDSRVDGGVCNG